MIYNKNIIILSMNSSDVKTYIKPTLGSILTEANSQQQKNINPQQPLNFPRINLNLKKTHFTKYKSAFLTSQQTCKTSISPLLLNHSQKKLNTENEQYKQKDRQFLENLNKRKWKINQKKGHKHNFFSLKTESPHNANTLQPESIIKKIHSPRHLKIDTGRFLITEAVRQYTPQKLNSPVEKIRLRSKQQINQNIKRSNRMISLIKEKCKLQMAKRSANTTSKHRKSKPQNLGIFSYLHRQLVVDKTISPQKLSQQKVKEYFQHPSDPKLQELINFKSRKFLKHKMLNDYKNAYEVKQFSLNLSKEGIMKQIEQKNQKYHKDYKKRISVPYFAYLSLPKAHKDNVLDNIVKKQTA